MNPSLALIESNIDWGIDKWYILMYTTFMTNEQLTPEQEEYNEAVIDQAIEDAIHSHQEYRR